MKHMLDSRRGPDDRVDFTRVGTDLIRVTRTVCHGLFGIEAEPVADAVLEPKPVIQGSITYFGQWHGELTVQAPVSDAMKLAQALVGNTDVDPVLHATDLVSELANVLAGNLKCSLPKGVDNSVPSATVIEAETTAQKPGDYHVAQRFSYRNGNIVVAFDAEEEQA